MGSLEQEPRHFSHFPRAYVETGDLVTSLLQNYYYFLQSILHLQDTIANRNFSQGHMKDFSHNDFAVACGRYDHLK